MRTWSDAAAAVSLPDPYARWARLTRWRGFERAAGWVRQDDHGGRRVRIIAHAGDDTTLAQALACPWLEVPATYHSAPRGAAAPARHFTATLSARRLDSLSEALPGLRWELAMPLRDAEAPLRASERGYFGPTRDRAAFDVPPVFEPAGPAQGVTPGAAGDVVAVIDVGCPFLHRDFAAAGGGTRIRALWDQDTAPAAPRWPWHRPQSLGYGREIGAAELDAMCRVVHGGAGTPPIDEALAYRSVGHLVAHDDPRRRIWFSTHGAHVLGMAAAGVDPLAGRADAAGRAELVFVQLPSLTAADSSGGSLSASLLDGVRYVLDACSASARVVINISYGSFAGPHDGSSLIEQALDELLEARPRNFAIVLGAGNSRQMNCHVRRHPRPRHSALLRFALSAADPTDTFVEAWYAAPASGHLRVRARTPDGDWSPWLAPGQELALRDRDANQALAALSHQRRVPNGARSMILLAVAPTSPPPDDAGPLAPPGLWQIEVDAVDTGEARVAVDAWIERDDPGDRVAGRQSAFVDCGLGDDDDTLSSLATGRHTLVAGGLRIEGMAPVAYSSTGPQRAPDSDLPLVYAACEDDALQPDLRACAVRSAEAYRMSGTSVAAPVLARRVFNWLQTHDVQRVQWAAALRELSATEPQALRLAVRAQ